jgi:beta-lactamase class D
MIFKNNMRAIYLILFCVGFTACRDSRIHEHQEWGKYFDEKGIIDAGFILRDQSHDDVHYYNLTRDTSHLLPASTFKILISLIALETGVIQDDKFIIPWNGTPSGKPEWDKDLNLREAFENSSEPFFKEVAKRIGKERMQHYLDTVNYGNKTMGENVETVWTDNTLKISADEQLGFIKRLYFNKLPFSERSQRITRSIMLRKTDAGKKYYYKTGWGTTDDHHTLWIVGFVEDEQKVKELKGAMNNSDTRNYVYFFAQNFDIPLNDTSVNWQEFRVSTIEKIINDYQQLKGKTEN